MKQTNTQFSKKHLLIFLGAVFLLASVLVLEKGYLWQNGNTESIESDDISGWKTYRNENLGVSFEYPPKYSVLKETNNEAELGFTQKTTLYTYLTIYTKNISDLQSIPICNYTNTFPCISKDGWNQQQPITDMSISSKDVYSVYVYYGLDSVARIIQTKDYPRVELSMRVDSAGLDRDFTQILSTLKFMDEQQTNKTQNIKGYITDISNNNGELFLSLDEVRWLSGEEAIFTATEETGCSREKIRKGGCAPSLNNGFYISNPDKNIETYKISTIAKMNSDLQNQVVISQDNYMDIYLKELVYSITIEGNEVTLISEEYIP